MGYSFVVATMNLLPGEKATRKLHKVWYNRVYDFGDYISEDKAVSKIHYAEEGVLIGEKNKTILLSTILKKIKAADDSLQENDEEETPQEAAEEEAHPEYKHAPTSDRGKELADLAIEARFHCSPESLFHLLYKNDEFVKFLDSRRASAPTERKMTEWRKAQHQDAVWEERDIQFIIKLTGPVGPSKTKCEIVEEVEHYDPEEYIAVLGTTRTPDVPFGSSFATKTRTVLTWSNHGGTRLKVTCGTEWSKSSLMKGVIERSSVDGQRKANKELVAALKDWIHAHPDDFRLRGAAGKALDRAALSHEPSKYEDDFVSTASREDGPFAAAGLYTSGLFPDWVTEVLSPLVIMLLCTNLLTIYLWLNARFGS